MTDGPFWGLRFQATIILNKEIEVMASKKTVMLVIAVISLLAPFSPLNQRL